MKNLLMTAIALLSFSSFAQTEAPEYYAPKFHVTTVSAMCPAHLPQGAQCGGFGSIVTVSATLAGCLDELVFSEFRPVQVGSTVELHVVAVARVNPKSRLARCYRANTVEKTISVFQMGTVDVINAHIEQH